MVAKSSQQLNMLANSRKWQPSVETGQQQPIVASNRPSKHQLAIPSVSTHVVPGCLKLSPHRHRELRQSLTLLFTFGCGAIYKFRHLVRLPDTYTSYSRQLNVNAGLSNQTSDAARQSDEECSCVTCCALTTAVGESFHSTFSMYQCNKTQSKLFAMICVCVLCTDCDIFTTFGTTNITIKTLFGRPMLQCRSSLPYTYFYTHCGFNLTH